MTGQRDPLALYEQLSMLLSGELSDAEAQVLRRRIQDEPEVARAWSSVQRVALDLTDLSDLAPPAFLDEAILDGPAVAEEEPDPVVVPLATRRTPWPVPFVGGLLVAALAAFLVRPAVVSPVLTLASGSQWVEGEVELLAGATPVRVDGAVRVDVTPSGAARRALAGQPGLDALHRASADSEVKVTVFRGEAWSPDGRRVGPGESFTVGALGTEVAATPVHAGTAESHEIERLRREVERLERALAEADFERQLVRGQLSAHVGEPTAWPDDLPAGWEPDRFEAALKDRLVGRDDLRLMQLDCSEWPCIATVLGLGEPAVLREALDAFPRTFAQDLFGDEAILRIALTVAEDQNEANGGAAAVTFAVAHPNWMDESINNRVGYRTDTLAKEALDVEHAGLP